jgi:hypothetical protein
MSTAIAKNLMAEMKLLGMLSACQVASNRDPSFASNNDPSGVMGLDLST